MTRKSKREIESALERIDGPPEPGPFLATIRHIVVDDEGEPDAIVGETSVRRDENGEWESDRTTYDLPTDEASDGGDD